MADLNNSKELMAQSVYKNSLVIYSARFADMTDDELLDEAYNIERSDMSTSKGLAKCHSLIKELEYRKV